MHAQIFLSTDNVFVSRFSLYQRVWIIDKFDKDNNCSLYGDGTGSKNWEYRPRECFITYITIANQKGSYLYRLQPVRLTTKEEWDDKTHYWDQSFYDKNIYVSEKDAMERIEKGRKNGN